MPAASGFSHADVPLQDKPSGCGVHELVRRNLRLLRLAAPAGTDIWQRMGLAAARRGGHGDSGCRNSGLCRDYCRCHHHRADARHRCSACTCAACRPARGWPWWRRGTRPPNRASPLSCDVGIHHAHLSEMDLGYFDSHCHLRPGRSGAGATATRCARIEGRHHRRACSDHAPVDEGSKLLPFGRIGKPGPPAWNCCCRLH